MIGDIDKGPRVHDEITSHGDGAQRALSRQSFLQEVCRRRLPVFVARESSELERLCGVRFRQCAYIFPITGLLSPSIW